MIENTQKYQESAVASPESNTRSIAHQVYEYAERRYGPGFAQYCVDSLLEEPETTPSPRIQHAENLVRFSSQLHSLSQVCSADFFETWSTEDKRYYMTLLMAVSNDLSQALQVSLEEINVDNNSFLKKQARI